MKTVIIICIVVIAFSFLFTIPGINAFLSTSFDSLATVAPFIPSFFRFLSTFLDLFLSYAYIVRFVSLLFLFIIVKYSLSLLGLNDD